VSTVLVVDDERDVRQLLSTYLNLLGFSVITASNGLEALTRLGEVRPCVILLDLMMPIMDGLEFRKQQRQHPGWSKIPVICLSAKHDATSIARDLDLKGCICKPFDIDEIGEIVRRHCWGEC
jgi:two-component system, chemotaxis family, chemotaxis protein CheY